MDAREASKVYYASTRLGQGDSVPRKLTRLMAAAGLYDLDLEHNFVAIKTHCGELGNSSYLRPLYARTIANEVKSAGGKPFVTDCSTLYPGMRKDAIGHLSCAEQNGFTSASCACPVIIGDGLKGSDEVALPVPESSDELRILDEALVGRAVVDADILISLTHAKCCKSTGYAGALKNVGMGCGSRAGKKAMHSDGSVVVNADRCMGCTRCFTACGQGALELRDGKAFVNENCAGCGHCLAFCPIGALSAPFSPDGNRLQLKIAEYASAIVRSKPCFHIAIAIDITPQCDCFSNTNAPIVPDIGMFASFDPVALDQAVSDAILAQPEVSTSTLPELKAACECEVDHLSAINPSTDWRLCIEHAEALGAGTRSYELEEVR